MVDLLAMADPTKDGFTFNPARNEWVKGGWTKTGSAWSGGLAQRQLLRLPHAPTAASYSIAVDCEVQNGADAMLVVLPLGATECALLVNGKTVQAPAGKNRCGIAYVDLKPEGQNQTTAYHDTWATGSRHTLTIDVDMAGTGVNIVAQADGTPLTKYTGPLSRLSIKDFRKFEDGAFTTFAVGSLGTQYRFHKVEVREYPTGRPQP